MDDRLPENELPEDSEQSADGANAAAGQEDPALLRRGLEKIRRRRWFVWGVLIIYLPIMSITERITHSFNKSLPVYFAWCLLLLVVAFVAGVARCPRCGNYFHMNGMTLLFLRRCLHCQLHLNADKRAD